jgi:hypothetical protein
MGGSAAAPRERCDLDGSTYVVTATFPVMTVQ